MMVPVQLIDVRFHNDEGTGLTSKYVIHASDDCLTHIALLYTALTIHSIVPDSSLYSTTVAIQKWKYN